MTTAGFDDDFRCLSPSCRDQRLEATFDRRDATAGEWRVAVPARNRSILHHLRCFINIIIIYTVIWLDMSTTRRKHFSLVECSSASRRQPESRDGEPTWLSQTTWWSVFVFVGVDGCVDDDGERNFTVEARARITGWQRSASFDSVYSELSMGCVVVSEHERYAVRSNEVRHYILRAATTL